MLAHYLGGGQTSLLFRTLVVEKKLAVSIGAYYGGTALDETRFYLYGMPAPGVSLETLDEEIAAIVAGLAEKGIDAADIERAKSRLVAETIYAQDNQARWHNGTALRSPPAYRSTIFRAGRHGSRPSRPIRC